MNIKELNEELRRLTEEAKERMNEAQIIEIKPVTPITIYNPNNNTTEFFLESTQINETNNYFASKAKRTMQKHNDIPKDVEFGFSSYAELLDDKECEMKELQKFVTQEYEEASRKATGFDKNSQFGAFFQGYAEAMKKVQDKLK